MSQFLPIIFAFILLIPGFFMTFIPGLPGLLYILTISLIYGIYDGFIHLTLGNLAVLATIVVISMIADLSSGLLGARWGGASKKSILWGILGMILGFVIIPIPFIGGMIGLFMGILIAEWYRTAHVHKAHRAAWGSFIGSLIGMSVNIVSALTLIILFVIFAIR